MVKSKQNSSRRRSVQNGKKNPPRSLHLGIHRFVRRSVGHFYIGGTSDNVTYHNEGDGLYFALRDGLISNTGKYINGPPDVTSTLTYIEIPASAEFTSLFDQYRVRNLKISFVPLRNVASGSNSYIPMMFVSRNDYNNVVGPSTIASIMQREDVISHRLDTPLVVDYKPKVLAAQIDLGNTISANSQFDGQWLNTSDILVMHSGLKIWIDSGGATGSTLSCCVVVVVEFDLEFRVVQ